MSDPVLNINELTDLKKIHKREASNQYLMPKTTSEIYKPNFELN